MSAEALDSIQTFRDHIIESGYVLDPEGTHHEFVSGMHGRKLDFDNIPDSSELYDEWVTTTARWIEDQYGQHMPQAVVGVANGTNRLALDVARRFDGKMLGLVSEKDPDNDKHLRLSKFTKKILNQLDFVYVLEDVGTTGSNSVQVAQAARQAIHPYDINGAMVLTTWQRRPTLERLEEAGVSYLSVIFEPLPTYTPEACQSEGYCAQGWQFIPRSK